MQRFQPIHNEIMKAFPKTMPPLKSEIASVDLGPDPKVIRRFFYKIQWWQADPSIIKHCYDKLPFFSPVGYQYYLPAYILYVLETLPADNLVLEFLVYNLDCSGWNEEWKAKQLSQFTVEQHKVIIQFLKLILDNCELHDYLEFAERAIKEWQEQMIWVH